MRKNATALIATTMFALAAGSAFATDTKSTAETAAPGTTQSMKTDSTGTPSGTTASTPGTSGAAADKSDKRKQVARNDPKCDESKVARASMPKDCFEKSGTGAAAVGSTQGQSGK